MAATVNPINPAYPTLHDPRRYASTPGFINHTPRDFEIKAAQSVLSTHPAMATRALSKIIPSRTASYCPSKTQSNDRSSTPAPQIRSLCFERDLEKTDGSMRPTQPVERTKLLQPRDAKGSRGYTAVDVAYFLRDTPPPHIDGNELDFPTKEPPSEKLKRVLKIGNARRPSSTVRPRTSLEHFVPRSVVPKVSTDGARYFQIVVEEYRIMDPPVQELTDDEKSIEVSCWPCTGNAKNAIQQILPHNDYGMRTTSSRIGERCFEQPSNVNHYQHNQPRDSSDGSEYSDVVNASTVSDDDSPLPPHGRGQRLGREGSINFSKNLRHARPGSTTSICRYRPIVIPTDDSSAAKDRQIVVRHDTSGRVRNAHQAPLPAPRGPLTAAPVRPLPPVPESRVPSLRLMPSNVTRIVCQNGRPMPSDNNNSEHISNQGLRRISREQNAQGGFYSFPGLPTHIPQRNQSLKAPTGINILPSLITSPAALQLLPAQQAIAARHVDDGRMIMSHAYQDPQVQVASQVSMRRQRVERTRARKLRDLQRTQESIDAVVKRSFDDSRPSSSQEPTINDDTVSNGPHVQAKPRLRGSEEITTSEMDSAIHFSPILLVAEQDPTHTRSSSKTSSSNLGSQHGNSIVLRGSLPFPIPPHYTPVSSPSGTISPTDVHPAFRPRSTVVDSSGHQGADQQFGSLSPVSRSATPVGADSFSSSHSVHTTALQPTQHRDSRMEARVDLLERENKLLDAALRAVLQTAGLVNGCPCGGQGPFVVRTCREDEHKRESEASTATTASVDFNELTALELYIKTRENLARSAGYGEHGGLQL